MDKQIQDIIKQYQFDKKTRKYSNIHYFNDQSIHRGVKNNNDVDKIRIGLINTIEYFETFSKRLENDDIDTLEKCLGKYEIAIHKVLQCYDNLNFKYTASELLELVQDWDKYFERINNIHFRKACQD